MRKRAVLLLVSIGMLVSLIAGCAGKGEGPSKTEEPQAADQMKAAQAQGMKQGKAGGTGADQMKQGQAKATPAGS